MINTASLIVEYCNENGLGKPSGKDLSTIGQKIRDKFNDQNKHNELFSGHIPGTGLMRVVENGWPMIVVGYPDEFKEKMLTYIHNHYVQKAERLKKDAEDARLAAERKAKPPRPRISSKRPIYSKK